eukprot:Tamp_15509.p1 GENE.Tamp_15509~~Tamp_15509.p1  ORF type:complete len:308 (+),score=62.90 Tamp_15509:454-1377(+)
MPKASTTSFEVWVSQDGEDRAVKDMVKSKFPQVHYIQHIDRSPLGKASPGESDNYYKIARHYGWGFQQVFADARYTWAIVLEDDLEVAPDFFNYMIAGAALLRKDASLWTVTAWNDNGLQQFAHDASKLYRSDFFGGLGWIMTRTLWNELGPKWPKGYWDDWMREPPQRRGRSCIRPEVSRTTTFGKEGSSNGQFFDSHLSKMILNAQAVPFDQMDLDYLLKDRYDQPLLEAVKAAPVVSTSDVPSSDARIEYSDHPSFRAVANRLGLMDDEKAGVPRTAYLGIVTLFWKGHYLYIAPRDGKPHYKQ